MTPVPGPVTGIEWVVYCETHGEYLAHVSPGGTTWRTNQAEARRFPTKPQARAAAVKATWLDHRPVTWALPAQTAAL